MPYQGRGTRHAVSRVVKPPGWGPAMPNKRQKSPPRPPQADGSVEVADTVPVEAADTVPVIGN